MRSDRRRIVKAGLLALSLGAAQLARGANMLAVRIWPAPDYSRVTLESDTALKTRQTFIDSPPRLAVDIEGMELNAALRELVGKVQASDPNIAGIRVGQFNASTVRLVIDLKRPIAPQVFTLQPVAAYAHRLVLDLYPSQAADPLEQLIQERASAKAPSTSSALPSSGSVNDPLGELIAKQGQGSAKPAPAPAAPSTRKQDFEPAPSAVMDNPNHPPRQASTGSTDRLIVIDEKGHGVDGDQLMALIGTRMAASGDLRGGGIVATIDLAGAEIELVSQVAREYRLSRAVEAYLEHVVRTTGEPVDYVFLDCPPSLGLLTLNGLVAAREVLLPIQCEYYALEGLSQLLRTVEMVTTHLNPKLQVSAILLTMYDGRTRLASQVADEVRTHFGTKVLETVIPRNVRISEAPSYAQSVLTYDPSSPGALTYQEAAAQFAAIDPQNNPQT